MNGLDTIIRDNLKWHARATVAAFERGRADRYDYLGVPPHAGTYGEYEQYFLDALSSALVERRATRGL